MHLGIVIFLALAPASSSSGAATRPEAGTAWVSVESAEPRDQWKARAFEGALEQSLLGMDRIRIAGSPKDPTIAIIIRGKLEGRKLSLKAFETWTGNQVGSRTISLGQG